MSERVVPAVVSLIERASDLYGRWHSESFEQWMFSDCCEDKMQSPIEQLFFVAFNLMALQAFTDVNPTTDMDDARSVGLWIESQFRIGRYRVDFRISYRICLNADLKRVLVELDGHDFHDRDKAQRSYEKRRDRDLQKMGYPVLHFTGSDVVADPLRCAHEVLEQLEATYGEKYDPSNPLGLD